MGPWGNFDPSSHNDPANLVSEREANVQTADTRGAITAVSDVDMEATDNRCTWTTCAELLLCQ